MNNSNIVEWHPAELFNDISDDERTSFALVILNVPLENLRIIKRLAKSAAYCIAADGAANRIFEIYQDSHDFQAHVWEDFHLQTIIGDLDSVRPEIQAHFESLDSPPEIVHQPCQDSTDFTKAVVHVAEKYPHDLPIVVVGSLYGRVDHAVSQLHHLFMFSPCGKLPLNHNIYLVTDTSISWVLQVDYCHVIHTRNRKHAVLNKHIGIIPFLGPSRITTAGLQWDVGCWESRLGGDVSTSNRVDDESPDGIIRIEADNEVLFTIDMVKEEDVKFGIGG